MVLQRKRRLWLGLGLAMTLGLVVALPATASAASTLTGETLNGSSSTGNSGACSGTSFSLTGTAAGPYAGTFQESGTWAVVTFPFPFSATFTITSGTTSITGSKSGTLGPGSAGCGFIFPARAIVTGAPYTATIHTPNGNFHDEGTSSLNVDITALGAATLTESFTSSLAEPVLIGPTSKDQCKNGGWKAFPQFKNQGQCVASVKAKLPLSRLTLSRSAERLRMGGPGGAATASQSPSSSTGNVTVSA